MQVTSIVMNAPFRVAGSLYLDGYVGMDFSFGHGRSASASGLTASGIAYSYRTQAGIAAAYRKGDTRVWVRTGLFAGSEEPLGTRLAVGALGSTFGGEIQLPVGHGNRLIGARLIVTPLKKSRLGLAVEFERSLRRNEPGHREVLTWVAASGGLWI